MELDYSMNGSVRKAGRPERGWWTIELPKLAKLQIALCWLRATGLKAHRGHAHKGRTCFFLNLLGITTPSGRFEASAPEVTARPGTLK